MTALEFIPVVKTDNHLRAGFVLLVEDKLTDVFDGKSAWRYGRPRFAL